MVIPKRFVEEFDLKGTGHVWQSLEIDISIKSYLLLTSNGDLLIVNLDSL